MKITPEELEAYLDEGLAAADMARIEDALRADAGLASQLAEVQARRDSEGHSLGSIWRRERLTCLSRDQFGAYLLGTLEPDLADYVDFHLETVGCRYCQANLADLKEQQSQQSTGTEMRRRKYFQSSVGYLKPK